jgi:hypothetical protein
LVIGGGGNLNGVTSLLKASAEKSFNYEIAGIIVGAIGGWLVMRQLDTEHGSKAAAAGHGSSF